MQHEKNITESAKSVTEPMLLESYQCKTGSDCLGAAAEDMVAKIVKTRRYSPQTCGNVHVVLAEVLNNIAEHSYEGRAGGQIQLHLSLSQDGVSIETLDFGKPMPGLAVPEPSLPSTNVARDALPEGGFGWYLIHKLAPSPHYIRRGNTNILRFTVVRA